VWRKVELRVLLVTLVACSSGGAKMPKSTQPRPPGNRTGSRQTFAIAGTHVPAQVRTKRSNAMLGTKTDATLAVGSSAIGDRSAFLLMRVRGDGSPDPSFGAGGRTVIPIGQGVEAWAAVTTPDSTITLEGSAASAQGDADLALARYMADGTTGASVLEVGCGAGGVGPEHWAL
jgi:hypothetical protein